MSELTTNAVRSNSGSSSSSGDTVIVDPHPHPGGGASEESVEESNSTHLNVLNSSSLSISSTTWRPPTPPRGLLSAVEGETAARPPSLSSKLSSMARRVVLNIGGVDTSVALSAADELLLSDTKEHPLSSSGSSQLPQNLYDLRRKAGLIRTRSNPLEIKSVSSDEYHSRRNKNGYRNIVGQTVVAHKVSPRASLFSSRKHAQDNNNYTHGAFSSLPPYPDDIESSQHQLLTNQTSTSLLAPQDAQLITSYTSLPDPDDDDNSVLATNTIRKQCNAFYDVDEVCNNVSSFPSPLKNINLMMAGLQQQQHPNASTAAINSSSRERLFFDNNLPSLSTANNHIPTHRRSNSARYFRELLNSSIQNNTNKRGMEYYCGGLENIVNWTDQTMVPEPCALTPLPSGVVDVDVSTNSTLYELNRHTGRVQIHLPKDDVRLVMDPNLEAGILCVVVTEDESKFQLYHTNSTVGAAKGRAVHNSRADESQKVPPLTYILTVDDDLYKRVLNELAERWSQPFGLYFCTHETDETSRVSPWFAGMILSVILIAMFIIVLVIQDD